MNVPGQGCLPSPLVSHAPARLSRLRRPGAANATAGDLLGAQPVGNPSQVSPASSRAASGTGIAPNDVPEGRQQNRRVELVRLD
jgi:hypothetical protein